MKFWIIALLLGSTSCADVWAQSTDTRVADLRAAGELRVGVFPPETARDSTGALRGWPVDVSKAMADEIAVHLSMIETAGPLELFACVKSAACDVAIVASHLIGPKKLTSRHRL